MTVSIITFTEKKGKTEEYHNLTDNIKTISSDNTELLAVTNNNKTTNTATLHPKHDAQKEHVLESTRNTIAIRHATNGTAEKTTVDTNPQKVLEHENLLTDYGISKKISGNTTKLGLEYTRVEPGFDLNNLENGCVRCGEFVNSPKEQTWFYVSTFGDYNFTIQEAKELLTPNTTFIRLRANGVWGPWREQVTDKSVIDALLAQKQDTLTAGTGITIQDNVISATGGAPVQGASVSIQNFTPPSQDFFAYKHVLTSEQKILITFSFVCTPEATECVLTGALKEQLEYYVFPNFSISNGTVTISNDGTNMKLINSAPSENPENPENIAFQHGTFTFCIDGGGTHV